MSIFVPWPCFEAYLISSRDCRRFCVPVDCSKWRGLKTHRALHVPTSSDLSNYSNWVLEGSSRHLVFMIARDELAVSVATLLLRVATDGLFGSYCLEDPIRPRKPLLVALHPSAILLIENMDIWRCFRNIRTTWQQ